MPKEKSQKMFLYTDAFCQHHDFSLLDASSLQLYYSETIPVFNCEENSITLFWYYFHFKVICDSIYWQRRGFPHD